MPKKHIVIVEDEYYIKNMKLFHNPQCKITKTIIDDDLFKGDSEHARLVKNRRKADKELLDFEYNKRFK
ncbi:MAG: hypothetical protein GY679_00940 [Mycoplasma sp.]|nr:hypothetical protein [Mycoplasma sp.]